MSDPAIDHPGVRLDAHLTASIEELKAIDAPKAHFVAEEPQPINPVVGQGLKAGTLMADVAPVPQPVTLPPVSPVDAPKAAAPKPKAPINHVAMAIKAVAAVNTKLVSRAHRIVERAALADRKVDDTFDKQEGALAATEDAMDMLDASLAAVGNEEGNA